MWSVEFNRPIYSIYYSEECSNILATFDDDDNICFKLESLNSVSLQESIELNDEHCPVHIPLEDSINGDDVSNNVALDDKLLTQLFGINIDIDEDLMSQYSCVPLEGRIDMELCDDNGSIDISLTDGIYYHNEAPLGVIDEKMLTELYDGDVPVSTHNGSEIAIDILLDDMTTCDRN